MKKLLSSITLIAGLLLAGNMFAQSQPPATPTPPAVPAPPDPNAPVLKFERDTINYGTIAHNSDGYRAFKFTNVGKEPLIIQDARGSCGCTIPTYAHEPIQPGAKSEIKVHYATDRVGGFTKTVTLTSNANPSTKVLVITGNVLPDPPAATTPTQPAAAPAGH